MSSSLISNQTPSGSWLSPKGKELQEANVLELWKQYNTNELAHLDLHFKYANWYSAFFIALFGAFIIGLSQYYESLFSLLFLALPTLVIVLAKVGKRALDRFYQRFLETVVEIAKLEALIGIDGAIKIKSSFTESSRESRKILWPKDEQFILSRHYRSRHDPNIESSEDFVKTNMRSGANKTSHDTFLAFQIAAALLLACGIGILASFHLNLS